MSWFPFPETKFAPASGFAAAYAQAVKKGRQRAMALRVAITGLARNVESTLPLARDHVIALGDLFGDYRVFVYENDSRDGTVGALKAWSDADRRVTIRSETLADPINPTNRDHGRTVRMAKYRAKCQEMVRDAHAAAKFDLVIVVDLDLPGGWSVDGVATSVALDKFAAIGSVGVKRKAAGQYPAAFRYYDGWAHRDFNHPKPHPPNAVTRDLKWVRGHRPFEVFSCFGGLAVYSARHYLLGEYGNGGDIEHANFHASIREQGGKIGLNPSQIVLYGGPE